MINQISETAKIGKNVKIWHFTYIGDRTEIGDNCKIGSLAHIDYDVKIGENTLIEGMVYIPPKCIIGKNCFIGPNVVLTNDPYPPSTRWAGVIIEDGVIIGASAVIRAGVRIHVNAVVGMGSVVVQDVPAYAVVMGNPAKIKYSRVFYDRKQKSWES